MAEPAVVQDEVRLVVLVHGIRDFAPWQMTIGDIFKKEGYEVGQANYGRMNLIEFLLPIPYFRKKASEAVWIDIRAAVKHVRDKYPNRKLRVSVIAHSFGTYVVTKLLKEEFDLELERLILCGAVVHYRFPFQQVSNRFEAPVLNDVGGRDPWPAVAEAVTFGYGSAGTYGFRRRPIVEDRYHEHAPHGYFFEPGFARKYWLPFLNDGTIVPSGGQAGNAAPFIRLLSIFKVKYLVLAALIALIAFAGLRAVYRSDPVAINASKTFYWSSVQSFVNEAAEPCPLFGLLCVVPQIAQMITERRFAKVDIVANEPGGPSLDATASCGPFKFPADGAPESRDAVALIESLPATYPQCVSATDDGRGKMTLVLHGQGMTKVSPTEAGLPATMWLCGCTSGVPSGFRLQP
jgi:pimeloyl-ACP methyl ester carboxylesterase